MNVKINDMSWPLPNPDVERALRMGESSRGDHLIAAEIMAAYQQMIFDPVKKRQMVIREIRKAMKGRAG